MGVELRDWGHLRELPGEVNEALLGAGQLGSVRDRAADVKFPVTFMGGFLINSGAVSALGDVLSQATGGWGWAE